MNLAGQINEFNASLELNVELPSGVEVMNPFKHPDTSKIAERFYRKFYNDKNKRKLILGINPGRLGAGITGIPFTDPIKLEDKCGIRNEFRKVGEPSAGFIYDMIDAYGGANLFYQQYLIYAVCPLGFTKGGINYNYYDSKALESAVTPFIMDSMKKILNISRNTTTCYCLGNGKNFKYLKKLNEKHNFFNEVIPLPHPRWIVQYRRKNYKEFISEYLRVFS